MELGIVKSFEKRKNKDSLRDTILLSVEVNGPDDVQTVELMNDDGVDSIPPKGSRVLIGDIGTSYKIAFSVDDLIPSQITKAGEKKIYSSENGAIKHYINWLVSGIELNGNTDFAVRFNALNTQFQIFVTDINVALGTKLDGSGTPGTLVLDILTAKVDEVKLK